MIKGRFSQSMIKTTVQYIYQGMQIGRTDKEILTVNRCVLSSSPFNKSIDCAKFSGYIYNTNIYIKCLNLTILSSLLMYVIVIRNSYR
jgi:hypothetical protein